MNSPSNRSLPGRFGVIIAVAVTLLLLAWAGMRLLMDTPADPSSDLSSDSPPSATEPVAPSMDTADTPVEPSPTPDPALVFPQPRPGGTVVELVAQPPDSFNPILTTNPTSLAILAKILPQLLGQDPHTGAMTTQEMAQSWTVSPDGRTYTFALRSDLRWSDGAPVTAQDFVFTYGGVADPVVQSPYRELTANLVDIEAPDAQTLVIRLAQPDCDLLFDLTLPWLPSHLFAENFSDLRTHGFNQSPTVWAGPLGYAGVDEDGSVRLVRNEAFAGGSVWLDGWTYRPVADPGQRLALLASGEADLALLPANRVIADPPGPGLTVYSYVDDGYSFVAVNSADPGEPVPGLDEAGAPLPQPPHPILGDPAVRLALAHAVDYEGLIAQVYAGYGQRLTSAVLPTVAWAYATDLPPLAYDPARAAALLDHAGWMLNGAAIRQKDGDLLSLSLLVNNDDGVRLALASALQEQWRAVGIDVTVQAADFGEVATILLDQSYDLAVAGWANLGNRPLNADFWQRGTDLPGSGFNFTSYANPQVEEWLVAAQQSPGCDPAQRAALYGQIQAQIQTDVPYIFLGTQQSVLVYGSRWQGIDPGPWGYVGNLSEWFLGK